MYDIDVHVQLFFAIDFSKIYLLLFPDLRNLLCCIHNSQ